MNYKHISTLTLALILSIFSIQAQVGDEYHGITSQNLSKEYNVITTAVPFMTITPDSHAGGMGDVGVATSSDVWSQSWNASKYALSEKDMSAGISYTPWLENMGIKDINLIYAAGYKKIKQTEAVGASLRYFSLGEIPAYDDNGNPANYTISPKEYAFDVSYSRYLSDFFVMGMTGRFIYSNLTGDTDPDYKPGKSVAADISGTFFKDLANNSLLTLGFNVSNLGSKIAYSSSQKDFIPTNLKIGAGYKMDIDNYNKIGFYLDINKLLVPTPPKKMYETDSAGNQVEVIFGNDNEDLSPVAGMFQSFIDAPGGFKEEMKEFIVSGGIEYWYNQQFAIRAGYFHEAETKGDRKFFTAGAGLRLNVFGLDFSYLIPVNGTNSPIANTFRFSLTFDFDGLAQESKGSMDKY